LGAKPVFADIDPATYNIDPESVRATAKRCKQLKAIMPVHLYGQCADSDALLAIARELGVPLVEDAAQAHGAKYRGKVVGAFGAMAGFSFYPGKNLGAYGEGGGLVTNDAAFAARANPQSLTRREAFPWIPRVAKLLHHHDFILLWPGGTFARCVAAAWDRRSLRQWPLPRRLAGEAEFPQMAGSSISARGDDRLLTVCGSTTGGWPATAEPGGRAQLDETTPRSAPPSPMRRPPRSRGNAP
jgi:hypothetical protein